MDEDFSSIPVADGTLIGLAERAEKNLAAIQKIRSTVLKLTEPHDWIDQNGRPYLQASGGEKVARLFGISWTIGEPILETEESGHFTYTYKGVFSFLGTSIEAIGTRSSKDGFFKRYGRDKVLLPPSEIDRGDVKKAAYTNLIGNGITRLLGIRNLTWEEIQASGIKRGARVDYRSGIDLDKESTYYPTETNPDEEDSRTQLQTELLRQCGSDDELMDEVLRQCAEFEKEGRTYSFKVADIFAKRPDGALKISDRWIATTLGKLKKRVLQHVEGPAVF